MGAADVLYEKAMNYKQKYLKNINENKKMFTDSYKEKALNYLIEATKLNHAQAYYDLAVIYSAGWKAKSVAIDNIYLNGDSDRYLRKADELGHKDASYDYALYLIRYKEDRNKAYQQALKVCRNGRPNDYIPLMKFYTQGYYNYLLPENAFYKKEVFELLSQHKPKDNWSFIIWEYALEYVDGLYLFGSKEDALEHIMILFSNLQFVKTEQHASVAELLLKMLCDLKNVEEIRRLLNLMAKDNLGQGMHGPLLRSVHGDLEHLVNLASTNLAFTYEEVFEICKERLVGKNQSLPITEAELVRYTKNNFNQYGKLLYHLGCLLMEGKGVEKNEQLGFIYLKAAKELPESKNRNYDLLGDCYYFGRVTKKDFQKALDIYNKSYPSLREVQTAYCYYMLKNYNEAFKRYLKLYNEKDPKQRGLWLLEGLGYMYFNGLGTQQDFVKAKQCFEDGIIFDSAYSFNMLGLCCIELGKETQKRCFKLFTAAYKMNEGSHVEYNIGRCYEFGYGVEVDLYKAKQWYELSVAHNYSYSNARLDEVNKKIKEKEAFDQQMKDEEAKKVETAKKAEALKKDIFNHDSSPSTSKAKLESLIGLASVKEEVEELEAQIIDYKRRVQMGLPASNISRHMVFTGNAGTGKTTVARIVADILKENGIVSQGQLIETDRAGLVGQFIGHTGPKTKRVVESALGGVLFIDEAYSLVPKDNDRDFGQEAITTLLKMMEDHKDDLVVIVAGYKNEMKDFIDANPGLKSRFTTYIHFPDYTKDELTEIFKLLASKDQNMISPDCFEKLDDLWDSLLRIENFGNGRAVRNVYEDVIKLRSKRLRTIKTPTMEQMLTITKEDIPTSVNLE